MTLQEIRTGKDQLFEVRHLMFEIREFNLEVQQQAQYETVSFTPSFSLG